MVRSLIDCIQIGPHRGDRLLIAMSSKLLDQRNMADAKPEKESARIGLGKRFLSGGHCEWIASVNVRNSCGNNDLFGRGQQEASLGQRFPSYGFAKPDGTVAELFQFRSRSLHLGSRAILELCRPDSDWPELW